ncbi:hypothetical protein TRIATDRAFT_300585 [Trichoderma atroviride IMI 206040]|uniref:Uncharacterized protein n=1 Tax=Hypocrea atroviridis (strain ATCC 20476 / IMI 206040) TaxID=452589 RepID=G9NY20_HYPAI|nr:uncharacterized protein TRIATDRAFT_300585 [Trichoderma atroviride IMI 206040]EHK44347.1 hypothetical protein TRIATDRAFT_300585 [Trichoderma atroviride IMI 206040]
MSCCLRVLDLNWLHEFLYAFFCSASAVGVSLCCVTLGFGYTAYMRPDGYWYDYNERDEYMCISQRG